jgi:ATP-dependent DNA helicase PIF1
LHSALPAAHSRFNIPIELFADTSLNVPKQTELAELFRRTVLIVWDEAPMQHRHCAEAVDRMLQDVRSCRKLFGGVVVLFGGDFRQCLPVVPKGSQSQIKDACLTSSYIWNKVRVLRLTENMRLQSAPMTDAERVKALAFGDWLKRVGDGLHDGAERDAVRVPTEHIVKTDDGLLDFVYPSLGRPFASEEAAMSYFVERALLAPTNADVDDLNRRLIGRLPKDAYERTFFSADSVLETDSRPTPNANQQLWPIEYLNSITVGGYPLHVLKLKVGCTILLLRNLDPGAGLCNGTRLLVTRLQPNAIHGRILGGDFHGNKAYIMRVGLDTPKSTGLPFILRRRQMPVRVGLALSINKSQGQSLGTVGLFLQKPVFTHGQFYVGVSRAKFPHGLKIRLEDSDEGMRGETKNIVYKDVLLAAAASH